MTLGEKSLRFDSGKSTIAPQYRAILNRVAVFSRRSRVFHLRIRIYG